MAKDYNVKEMQCNLWDKRNVPKCRWSQNKNIIKFVDIQIWKDKFRIEFLLVNWKSLWKIVHFTRVHNSETTSLYTYLTYLLNNMFAELDYRTVQFSFAGQLVWSVWIKYVFDIFNLSKTKYAFSIMSLEGFLVLE